MMHGGAREMRAKMPSELGMANLPLPFGSGVIRICALHAEPIRGVE